MLATLLSLSLLAAPAPQGAPSFELPEAAGILGVPLELRGHDFGAPGPGSGLELRSGAASAFVPSTDPSVREWRDDRVLLDLPAGARSGRARLHTPAGATPFLPVLLFEYRWYDIPPTPGTNAHPLAIAVGPDHQVWVNQEFHLDLQRLDPATGVVTAIPIPRPPNPGPFASMIFGDHRTQTSTLGEDVLVDPRGCVWFTQGGGSLYSGAFPNHSRIVRYDPAAPAGAEFRVYNVPGDWNEVIGLAWDEARQRMWFANAGLDCGARVASFDPERIPWDNHFAFDRPLLDQLCAPGAPVGDCYQVFELPNPKSHPAHLLVDPSGKVWYTAYWGNAVGCIDPDAGTIVEYPLPPAISTAPPVWVVGSGPWQIVLSPGGDIVFNEFFDSTIGRIRPASAGLPVCQTLDPQGRNPCIDERVVPGADLEHDQLHSIAFDPAGRLWFTQHTSRDRLDSDVSLGYVTAGGRAIVRLPSLAGFPAAAAPSAAGLAIDPVTGDLWFAEFWRQRIGLLRPLPPL